MSSPWVPAIVGSVFFLTLGAVILLWPITRRLGRLLEVLIEEKSSGSRAQEGDEQRRVMEALQRRLALTEERLDFAESLLHSQQTSGSVNGHIESRNAGRGESPARSGDVTHEGGQPDEGRTA